ncbi:hypothetical protein ACOMICROBIO_NCLOACGD_05592 [Vibrio sp. B1ASS3]|uniref:hypothetical protein n=1 Tax=Vibrio sp. B1ASS3 TaxID=2751176 RepID=UPI001ABA1BFB|nr:hypothetical protein [Vibrio sp. B1ASS3]CAD7827978.1 hypothetical protein ACOMICROBIO_NCLOACGD_05592 [Vibrio sp. B1ASS3]CAE6967211.1 hypothetical protein ACOMICROBIO_NCLOACGD_05592 [Vibrio sp. B1ASS3]
MTNGGMKLILRWLGRLITVFAIAFVLAKITDYSQQINVTSFSSQTYFITALCVLLYAFGNLLLARAWGLLLSGLGSQLKRDSVIWVFGVSQLAKYLPGNVFQFANRQIIGVEQGINNHTLLKSSAWEVGLMIVTASTFSTFLITYYFPSLTWLSVVSFFTLNTVISGILLRISSIDCVKALGLYLIFFTLSGSLFSAVYLSLSAHDGVGQWSQLIAYFVIAWLAGFLTPGAPAGLGVREAVLLVLLGTTAHQETLLLAVLLSRIITVFGDLLFFAIASFYRPRHKISTN